VVAIFTPLRLDRLQQGLFEVLAEATGVDVQWSYSQVPGDQLGPSFVTMMMVGGPGPFIRKQKRGRIIQPVDSITLTMGPLVVGKRIGVLLNEFNYFEDVIGGDTPDIVRDRFIAQLNDVNNIEPVTASAGGAGELVLVPDFTGGIVTLGIYGAVTAGVPTLNAGFVNVVTGAQTMLVNIQAFSKEREPRNGAWAIIGQCLAALQSEDLVTKLRRFGVAVWDKTSPIDLSAVDGGHWETRVSFDVTLAARAIWVRPTEAIETVNITLNTEEPTTTQSITVVSP
jgi:hypothetical protein